MATQARKRERALMAATGYVFIGIGAVLIGLVSFSLLIALAVIGTGAVLVYRSRHQAG